MSIVTGDCIQIFSNVFHDKNIMIQNNEGNESDQEYRTFFF